MNIKVPCGSRTGSIRIPSSKSMAHRMLIASALSGNMNQIKIDGMSNDIKATINCLDSLLLSKDDVIHLYCQESGTTLRLLLPIVGALGRNAVFHMEGRLPERPMDEYINVLSSGNMIIEKRDDLLICKGRLIPKDYTIRGDISSQYISGLLYALPLLDGDSTLTVTGPIESSDYIKMTEDVINHSQVSFTRNIINKTDIEYSIKGNSKYYYSSCLTVEADWSNAAFFMCMGALSSSKITLYALNTNSLQGDIAICDLLKAYGAIFEITNHDDNLSDITITRGHISPLEIDASQIPDLVPTLCAVAAGANGRTRIYNAARLRLKESDRIMSTAAMLSSLGADITETDDGLIIDGHGYLDGGCTDTFNDHRIAMAAAVASVICKSDVIIKDAECVNKSYPRFFEDLNQLELIR